MNKEVIYLEPEDDITDILTKLQQAGQKLVALVPPKKSATLRSAVNMKLVARAAKECEKVVVVVTADPGIAKLAMAARIPVAKSLNSRPVIPPKESGESAQGPAEETLPEGAVGADESGDAPGNGDAEEIYDLSDDFSGTAEEQPQAGRPQEASAKDKQDKPAKPAGPRQGNFFVRYRKAFLIGVPVLLVLVAVLVWAFVFAPAARITVAIGSSTTNFSENIHFVTNAEAQDAAAGNFYAQRQELKEDYTAEFTASGEEDRGHHASGTVSVSYSFVPGDYRNGFTHDIEAGETFMTAAGEKFSVQTAAALVWDGEFPIRCNNGTVTNGSSLCTLSASVELVALEPGEEYNLEAGTQWKNFGSFGVSNAAAFSGGTSDIVKIVRQSDVDAVQQKLLEENKDTGKKKLLDSIKSSSLAIEESYAAESGEIKVVPAVGDIVGENTKPTATLTVVYSVSSIERSSINEFVRAKLALGEDRQIYAITNPYIDRFTALDAVARLKATVETGPLVTEDAIFERVRGRKVGEVQSQLRSIEGFNSVDVSTSYFWVSTVPDQRDKVTIVIEGAKAQSTSEDSSSQAASETGAEKSKDTAGSDA